MENECPHLGIPGDKEVRFDYATNMNVCYADEHGWSDFLPIEEAHQQQFCLNHNYLLCPTYMRRLEAIRQTNRRGRSETFLEFYGLRREPFSIVPQPHFLCESETQKQAHAGLRWLIDHRQGLGLLLGPIGTGKTLLCHTLLEEMEEDAQYAAALLLTPSHRTEYALMSDLLALWDVRPERRRSLRDLEEAAHNFFVETVLGRGKTVVLIVDEAQTLAIKQYQQLCKMLNWQDRGQQLLQIILAGQPGLLNRLSRVPALRDRAVVEFTLTDMTVADMQRMISGRLERAGRRGDLFAPSAMLYIYQLTGGVPRRVNILCLRCLWLAYQEDKRYITRDVVKEVVRRTSIGNVFAIPDGKTARTAIGWLRPVQQRPVALLPRLLQRVRALVAA